MKVAVTGSTGLIGTALVASLRGDGHEVVRVVRGDSAGAGDGPTVRWDLDRRTIDAAGVEGLDAVVHLAGEGIADKRWTDAQKRRVLESRTVGTSLLAETLAALSSPPAVLLSGSGIHVYGDRGDEVLPETAGTGTLFLSEVCQAWEAAAQPAIDAGIRTAFLRTSMVLDGHGGALGKLLRLFRLGLGGRLGKGRQWMPWIAIDDEVGAIRFAIDHDDLSGPVNLTAPAPVRNADFTRTLGRVLHRPTVLRIPRVVAKLPLGVGDLAQSLLFSSAKVMPKALVDHGYQFRHPELEPALRAALATPSFSTQ